MKLKELEGLLQDVAVFDEPKIHLEQYVTTPHLASRILFTAHSVYDDIENKIVADFGCGCGILRTASHQIFSDQDIDPDALRIASDNCSKFELSVDFLLTDLTLDPKWQKNDNIIDTIVMNPPFGTKNKGVDMIFLKKAVEVANNAVYSLHKTSTREHILKKAKEWGVDCEVLAELKFDIPNMYKFHRRKSVDIQVDFLRLAK
ncbi:9663_t:CDS:2 [Ambispora gerdemannii]|uniref:Methyltransferase-like protein 5 n=1 Tax=Ambispora gerdemannii TaxID=144530 RepID=A0A9N9B3W7_9GLOM|nr:9663_t:CDS:2 [Ambispora gerdemannii]